jgi:ankyrin repeat protein
MPTSIALLLAAGCLMASCGAAPSANDPRGQLIFAARTGDVATIRRLAARGVDLDSSSGAAARIVFPDLDHMHSTALQHAVRKHQVDAVRVLLEWGADPDATESGGATPLYIAVALNDEAAVKLLLDAGADVDKALAMAQAEAGGPLWHLIEHALERGRPDGRSPKDVLERMRATPAPSPR